MSLSGFLPNCLGWRRACSMPLWILSAGTKNQFHIANYSTRSTWIWLTGRSILNRPGKLRPHSSGITVEKFSSSKKQTRQMTEFYGNGGWVKRSWLPRERGECRLSEKLHRQSPNFPRYGFLSESRVSLVTSRRQRTTVVLIRRPWQVTG